jgi:16S rRNA (cytosine1402-N4)-methyltransferase
MIVHNPVLEKEVIEALKPTPDKNFVDCTVGEGGHALLIIKNNAPDGKVLGIDWDANQIKEAIKNIDSERFVGVNDSYVNLKSIVEKHQIGPVSGILFDLGMSSVHTDISGRGFSFLKDEPLDMRYNQETNYLTAEKIIRFYTEEQLTDIFTNYGQEKLARKIAKRIIETRKIKPIKTTFDLISVIGKVVPLKFQKGRTHFATRVFQALRIAVNEEFKNIESALPIAFEVLSPGGRLVVISFHSLEDRIVKNYFRDLKIKKLGLLINKKPIKASSQELITNNRSRSAMLRAIEKI